MDAVDLELELENGKNRREDMVVSTFPEYALTSTGCVGLGGSGWEEVGLRTAWRWLSGPASALEVVDADADARGHGNVVDFIMKVRTTQKTPLWGVGLGAWGLACACAHGCAVTAEDLNGWHLDFNRDWILSGNTESRVNVVYLPRPALRFDLFSTAPVDLPHFAHHESVPGM